MVTTSHRVCTDAPDTQNMATRSAPVTTLREQSYENLTYDFMSIKQCFAAINFISLTRVSVCVCVCVRECAQDPFDGHKENCANEDSGNANYHECEKACIQRASTKSAENKAKANGADTD